MFNAFDSKFDTDSDFRSQARKALVRRKPRVFDTPEEMDLAVDRYIHMCMLSKADPTYTGMVLALGLSSRQAFLNYREYDGYEESVDRALLLIEHEYEKRLVTYRNTAGPMFALKQFGWKDKTEHALTGAEGAPLLPPVFNITFPDAPDSTDT